MMADSDSFSDSFYPDGKSLKMAPILSVNCRSTFSSRLGLRTDFRIESKGNISSGGVVIDGPSGGNVDVDDLGGGVVVVVDVVDVAGLRLELRSTKSTSIFKRRSASWRGVVDFEKLCNKSVTFLELDTRTFPGCKSFPQKNDPS